MNRIRLASERGVTLVEVSMMLIATLAILGALAPTLSAVIRRAETTAATTAMTDLSNQVLNFLTDTGFSYFTVNGQSTGTQVELLVSDGDIPRDLSGTGSASWQATVNNTTGLTDFLGRHLIFNEPRGSSANAYSTEEDVAEHYWRGAYLTAPLDPDPWGNRYGINVQFLGTGSANDVVVFSAGPDEEIDTQFAANPLSAGDDDLIVLVES